MCNTQFSETITYELTLYTIPFSYSIYLCYRYYVMGLEWRLRTNKATLSTDNETQGWDTNKNFDVSKIENRDYIEIDRVLRAEEY